MDTTDALVAIRKMVAQKLARENPITYATAVDLLEETGWNYRLAQRALDAGIAGGAIRLMRETLKAL